MRSPALAVLACGLVEHRHVRLDAVLMHQPGEHLSGAIPSTWEATYR
jgi:hypothetical protein